MGLAPPRRPRHPKTAPGLPGSPLAWYVRTPMACLEQLNNYLFVLGVLGAAGVAGFSSLPPQPATTSPTVNSKSRVMVFMMVLFSCGNAGSFDMNDRARE